MSKFKNEKEMRDDYYTRLKKDEVCDVNLLLGGTNMKRKEVFDVFLHKLSEHRGFSYFVNAVKNDPDFYKLALLKFENPYDLMSTWNSHIASSDETIMEWFYEAAGPFPNAVETARIALVDTLVITGAGIIVYPWSADMNGTEAPAQNTEHGSSSWESKTAVDFLRDSADIIEERGKQRDQPNGERSFKITADVLNIRLREKLKVPLTGADVALVLGELKRTRQMYGQFTPDDYIDEIAYTSLRLEEVISENKSD